jgi:hypothetical protein
MKLPIVSATGLPAAAGRPRMTRTGARKLSNEALN